MGSRRDTHVEETLKESEEKLKIIGQTVKEAIIMMDHRGAISYWNKAAERMLGYTHEEAMGQHCHRLLAPPKYLEHYEKGFGHFISTGTGHCVNNTLELTAITKAGITIPVELSVSSVNIGGHWNAIGIVRDLSEKKMSLELLKESESRLRKLFENTLAGTGLATTDGKVIDSNDALLNMIGYSLEEIKKIKLSDLYVNPSEREGIIRELEEKGVVREKAVQLKRKDGELMDILLNISTIQVDGDTLLLTHAVDVTGLKRTKKALRANEARLKEAERIAHVGHWEMDIATGKSYWSDGFFRICGLEPGSFEPTSEMGMQIIHPDDRERAAAEVQAALNQGKPYEIQKRIVRPDGTVRTVESRGEIVLDNLGKPLKMVGTFLDITGRKKAEDEARRLNEELEQRVALRTYELHETMQKLRESEERFRSVVDSMNDVIFTLDREQRHTGVYGQWVEKSGLTPEMFLGKTSAQILGPEDAASHEKANVEALKGKSTVYDWTANYPDGSIRHFQTALSPLRDADGQIVGITGVGRDITENKRNEEAISTSLELFRQMDSASKDEIIQTGLEEGERLTRSQIAYFHLVNPDQKTIAQQAWSRNTFNYCSAEEKATHYPIDLAGVWVDCIRQRKPVIHNDYDGLPHKKGLPEGHVPVLRDLGVPVFEGDNIVAVIGVGNKETDYTDFDVKQLSLIAENTWSIIRRMRTQEELQAAKEEAENANRSKSEFLANMSHEIRTPLNAVTGFSELLSSMVTDERQQNYLNSIKTAGKSLLTLINDILDLSKMEAGMMKIQYSPVNPHVILNEIEQIFKLRVSKKGLSFNMDIDPKLPSLMILDEARLRQVLLNLVGNAVKFTEQGSVTVTARCVLREDKPTSRKLSIAISDTGIGIPREEQENIFDSFRQQSGQSNRKYGGTGLGLSVSKKLSQMMNGAISVESTPGVGSIFTLTLHDVRVADTAPVEHEVNRIDFSKVHFDKVPVLVVDDVESNRLLLKELLGITGLEVFTAENGEEALLLANELHPELIIMDIRMPVMDGIECTKRLKENPDTKDIPVVALSASTKVAEDHLMVKSGFDGYLPKPVSTDRLYDNICRFLNCTGRTVPVDGEKDTETGSASAQDPDQLENAVNLPQLINTLNREILPLLPSIAGAKRMKDVKVFARRLLTLGRFHRAVPLTDLAEQLSGFAGQFDITAINRTVERFPGLVEQLEAAAKEP